tara:strand:+ start:2798 stop:3757 length:960 start_codon:yes stop_codon:yes gene_type:complete
MILITGSAGYIGSHLSLYFEKRNISYIGIDNLSYSYKANLSNNKKHYILDISNKKKIIQLIKKYNIKTVIHTAACSYVLEGEKNKKKYNLNNVKKTKQFINVCLREKINNFIFLSSSNVYKEKKKNIPVKEIDPKVPKNIYGKNKLNIENYLRKKNFDNIIILRLFNIIGIFNKNFKIYNFKKNNFQRLVFKLIQNTKKNKVTKIHYTRSKNKRIFPSRDFLDINDLSKIIERILFKIKNKKKIMKILNISSNRSIQINKIINSLKKKIKKNLNVKYIEISNKEYLHTRGSNKKLFEFVNYSPKINLDKILKSHLSNLN